MVAVVTIALQSFCFRVGGFFVHFWDKYSKLVRKNVIFKRKVVRKSVNLQRKLVRKNVNPLCIEL